MVPNPSQALAVIPGDAQGQVIFSDVPLSFMMGVDSKTGIVADAHHPLRGTSLKDSVLVIPAGRGSCSGSSAIAELILCGNAPAALIFRDVEMILTLGVLVAEKMFDKRIPIVFLSDAPHFEVFRQASTVQINKTSLLVSPGGHKIDLVPQCVKALELNPTDKAILSGESGEASRIAMEIIVKYATIQGAQRLIDVSQVHVDACAYVGESSLLVPERLLSLGGKFVVPSTCNSLNVDRQRWKELGANPEISQISDKIGDTYLKLGAKMSFTCAPYLLESKPKAGEQVGWSESNAVVFANSVLGAHTQKYPDYMDVFIALTGRAPYAGCHVPEGRKPEVIIKVTQISAFDPSFFALIGYSIGHVVAAKIPVVIGMETTRPTVSDLKAFGAGFATSSSAPMFHINGITPEAASFEDALTTLETIEVTIPELQLAWRQLNTATDPSVDIVSLGNPHFSLEEFSQLAEVCRGRHKSPNVEVMITTGRETYTEALNLGYLDVIESFGARLITDTCWCMIEEPVVPLKARNAMTNSAKYAHYGPGIVGKKFHFGDVVACIKAASRGHRHEDEMSPRWLFR
ncbi:hypothetical protein BDP67DRAFT_524557 [Colletotrichum lupini]|nr:hypothetical protein BDP67DRAFT_524557 [Colletotrichum lupini]